MRLLTWCAPALLQLRAGCASCAAAEGVHCRNVNGLRAYLRRKGQLLGAALDALGAGARCATHIR